MKILRAVFSILLSSVAVLAADDAIIIKATTVIDGKGSVLKDTTLVVEGSRVTKVGRDSRTPTIDLSGLTVMPGWIDTHVHLSWHFGPDGKLASGRGETAQQSALYAAGNAYVTLMAGFTTVQSLGAPIERELRDAIAQGVVPGPRILTSMGSLNEMDGDPAKIRARVKQMIAEGADVLKIFATKSIRDGGEQSMTDAQIQAACDEARALGKRIVVHAHASDGAKASILAGCTSIEHGTMLNDEVLDLMGKRGVYLDPNFLVLHNYLDNKPRFLGIGNYTEEGFAYMEKALPLVANLMRRATVRKLKIVFGTDAVAGAHGRNAEEFVYRVRDGGQAPVDAITGATSLAAESLGLGDRIGTIGTGMEADLIATEGNPLDDINAVRRLVFVMKGGKIYRNEARASRAGK